MKLSDDFDPRCLRSRKPGTWRSRLGTAVAILLILLSIILLVTGSTSLLNQPAALTELNDNPAAARIMIFTGVTSLLIGLFIWRLCRRRLRRDNSLSLSPHLMKRRD